jgi:hypothetical protein
MRRSQMLLATAAAVGLTGAAVLPAVATSQAVDSRPNGDYSLNLRVGSATNKDGDGSIETATSPDTLLALYSVCGRQTQGTEPGVVQLAITIDAPGTASDRQVSGVADLERFSCVNLSVQDKVANKWPAGTYTVTIDADNGRDTATVSGSVVIN